MVVFMWHTAMWLLYLTGVIAGRFGVSTVRHLSSYRKDEGRVFGGMTKSHMDVTQ
jgi:hypothetical protein